MHRPIKMRSASCKNRIGLANFVIRFLQISIGPSRIRTNPKTIWSCPFLDGNWDLEMRSQMGHWDIFRECRRSHRIDCSRPYFPWVVTRVAQLSYWCHICDISSEDYGLGRNFSARTDPQCVHVRASLGCVCVMGGGEREGEDARENIRARARFLPQPTPSQCTTSHCNALQRTATHCNTLQRTATHCNALQRTATHCNILQHSATHTSSIDSPHTCFAPHTCSSAAAPTQHWTTPYIRRFLRGCTWMKTLALSLLFPMLFILGKGHSHILLFLVCKYFPVSSKEDTLFFQRRHLQCLLNFPGLFNCHLPFWWLFCDFCRLVDFG